jgi:hypothetical protein
MTEIVESVKKLVHDLLDAGCDLMAVAGGYVVNEPEDTEGRLRVQDILGEFGPRMHLVAEISNYIRSLGRFYDP